MAAEVLILVVVTATGFVATNLDNLLALTVLAVSAGAARARVMAGYALSVLAVVGVGLGLGLADDAAGPASVRLLGLVPLAAGAVQLARLARRGPGEAATVRRVSGTLPSMAVFAAMSLDSVAVLGPLVADSADRLEPVVLGTWLAMGAAWIWLAGRLASRPAMARLAERAGARAAPLLMMAVGVYILLDTPTDVLAG